MNHPKVSILVPVYNRERYIGECIQSALDQTITDSEIVVVDNASTDRTWEICQEYASQDARIRIFRNESNIGPVRNWLACVAHARGDYGKILWSDDLMHPQFLEKLIPFLDNPETGFVYSAVTVFKNGQQADRDMYSIMDTGVYPSERFICGALGDLTDSSFPMSPGCAIFRMADIRKNLLLQVPNRVDSDFSMQAIGNDLLLFLLTAKDYRSFAFVNEHLAFFRDHSSSITMSSSPGRIPLHYDLAKGYFAEKFISDRKILKRLNTIFLLHLLRYKSMARSLGINKVSDFYPSIEKYNVDWLIIAKKILMFVWKRIKRI